MKLLREISDATLGIGPEPEYGREYRLRKSARGVVLNDQGQMAVLHVGKFHFHKLPGGGLHQGETVAEALQREIKEEVGCDCAEIQPLGMVIEYRDRSDKILISYGFSARVDGAIGEVALEPEEVRDEQTIHWMDPAAALATMQSDTSTDPEKQGPFILAREIAILEAFLETT